MSTGSPADVVVRTYVVRWYLLTVVSLHCCLYNAAWAEFPPIAQSVKLVYDWSDSNINMSLNYGNIGTILMIFPVTWIVFAKGMRYGMIFCTLLTAVGITLKSLPLSNNLSSWLIPIGLFLNGCGGAVTSCGPTVLSETWFPPTQRATATVFYIVSAGMGGAFVFVVGPAVVPEPIVICDNVTWSKNSNCSEQNKTYPNFQEVKDKLYSLNYAESAVAVLLFVSVLLYFPNKPEHPPSITATKERLGMFEGIKTAVTQRRFWHLVLCCAIPTAVYGAWITTSDVVLNPFGISQKEAGRMSFSGSIGGILLGIILSRVSDLLQRKMKAIMVVIFGVATLFFLLFVLLLKKVLPSEPWLFYFTFVAACVLTSGAQPLYYEMTCENLFPVSEAIISGFISFFLNVGSSAFLFITLIPHIGKMWPNWAIFVTSLLSVLVLAMFREEYRRLDIDIPISQSQDSESRINQSNTSQPEYPINQSDASQSEYPINQSDVLHSEYPSNQSDDSRYRRF
ncbi:solute carrier family 49 member 4 homolog [Saccostrea echinata]|uniref:solute carrier family 49 member 4 homolog n=1 Tax=Saccostrea echinata TaxID=191078 RepID=UPI002A827F7E|nr:solute carrier family 49 member 4 homolog [Saccostrea echinata]